MLVWLWKDRHLVHSLWDLGSLIKVVVKEGLLNKEYYKYSKVFWIPDLVINFIPSVFVCVCLFAPGRL